jgi:uncharacterized protein (TIGR02246 family)
MRNDEDAIRELVATWMAATQAGDADAVLDLMTDDAVFLVSGQAPFGKAAFASAMQAQAGAQMRFDGHSEIREVQVSGDWAFAWAKLAVTATSSGQPSVARAGHTLSIFRKQDGRWRLARDANLLAPVDASTRDT